MKGRPSVTEPQHAPDPPEPDDGLRRILTWTFVALVVTLLFAFLGIYLVTRWFGGP